MYRVRTRDLGRADDGGDVEVRLDAARPADAHGLIGETHVKAVPVGLGVHRHGLDPELAARPYDAQRDLAAVGDQDLVEHVRRR